MKAPRVIAVVKPSSLGDVVHTLPAVSLLHQHWPGAELHWVVNAEWAPLLEGNPHLTGVTEFPRSRFRGLGGFCRVLPWFRAFRRGLQADLVVDFQGLLRSALLAKACAASGAQIVGLSDAREGSRFFYQSTVDVSARPHAVDRYLRLVESLGVPIPPRNALQWHLPQGSPPAGVDFPEDFILLHPYSRGTGKSLSDADIHAFCNALAPWPIVIAGRSTRKAPALGNTIDLVNRTTLAELNWLIRHAKWVVSVDSGPMHMAAALTSRLVSIHTWSDPAKVGPYRADAWVLKDGSLAQMAHFFGERPAEESMEVAGIEELAMKVGKLASTAD